jgi:RNA polymerase sigma factor (sigma-70 family)
MPHLSDQTYPDRKLVEACLDGDETAWVSLIQRYRRLIYTIPLRFGMPVAAAEEVFQEVCLILLQNLHTIRDHTRLSSWLVTVTRRICIEHWRRGPLLDDIAALGEHIDEHYSDLEENLLSLERRHTLQRALEQLDERCRRLLDALFLCEDPPSYAEIAREMEMTEGSVGPTRARCLDKLREFIVKIEGEGRN